MDKFLNIPLDEETRKWLDKEAKKNGRAVRRQAAEIIKDAMRKDKEVCR